METLISFLTTLNGLSPLAVIALLATIIYMLVKGKTNAGKQLREVQTNHLHELPEIAETLRRIEQKLSEEFGYIRGRLNGKSDN